MLVEILALLNVLAAVALAVLTFRYSARREKRWQTPLPAVENRQAYERERRYRTGLDARRMVCLLGSILVSCPLAIYLSGHLQGSWTHEWLRLGTALVTLATGLAVMVRTGVHNEREYECWARRYR